MALTLEVGLGATYAAVAGALAFILFRTPGRVVQLRLLATWLLIEAVAEVIILLWSQMRTRDLAAMVGAALSMRFAAGPFVLLAFLGTIETPLARPYARPSVRRFLLATAAVFAMLAAVFWDQVYAIVSYGDHWALDGRGTILAVVLPGGAVTLYGVLVAIDALRRSQPGSLERSRAALLLPGVVLTIGAVGIQQALMFIFHVIDPALHLAYMQSPVGAIMLDEGRYVAHLVGCAVLVYGILRVQLFDVDLRLKATIGRGTLVAFFVGALIVVAQLAQNFLSDAYGWAAGGLAAGLLLVALHPLQRAAERVADAAMPSVRDTTEWRDERKVALYRTAVRLALSDRSISRDKEMHLADLATQLGLDPRSALELRHGVESEISAT